MASPGPPGSDPHLRELRRGESAELPALRLVRRAAHAERSRETRKTVTIVFADLKATTSTARAWPGDAARRHVARIRRAGGEALARHGGTVEKFIGDAVMAVFGLPVRHEDDALRAVRAALEMRRALDGAERRARHEEGIELDVHIGVNTGEVVAGEASPGSAGDGRRRERGRSPRAGGERARGADRAAHLQAGARHVEVEEVEPLTVKGKAQPVRAYRLLETRSPGRASREPERRWWAARRSWPLSRHLRQRRRRTACRMVTVVGDAGVGKTRLTQEFAGHGGHQRADRPRPMPALRGWHHVLADRRGRPGRAGDRRGGYRRAGASRSCGPGRGDDEIAERVGAAIGLVEAPFQVAELFWGIRRFLEMLADERPMAVVFDDIHWAEATFLELIGAWPRPSRTPR